MGKFKSDEAFLAEVIVKVEKKGGIEGCFEYSDYNESTDHYVDIALKRDESEWYVIRQVPVESPYDFFDLQFKTVPRTLCTDEKAVRSYLMSQEWVDSYEDSLEKECFSTDELIKNTRMRMIKSPDNKNRHVDENGKIHAMWRYAFATNGWADNWCSNCGYTENHDVHVYLNYDVCPKCGAIMDLKIKTEQP